jgi:hypothetical protein
MITYILKAKGLDIGAKPARRPKRPSLATELRHAEKAGRKVRSSTTEPDGRVTLQYGEPDAPEPTNDLDTWLAKHAH